MGTTYTDVYNIKHNSCKIVDTVNIFNRIFIIEDQHGSRFTCVKKNAPKNKKTRIHWKLSEPKDAPKDYAVPYDKQE